MASRTGFEPESRNLDPHQFLNSPWVLIVPNPRFCQRGVKKERGALTRISALLSSYVFYVFFFFFFWTCCDAEGLKLKQRESELRYLCQVPCRGGGNYKTEWVTAKGAILEMIFKTGIDMFSVFITDKTIMFIVRKYYTSYTNIKTLKSLHVFHDILPWSNSWIVIVSQFKKKAKILSFNTWVLNCKFHTLKELHLIAITSTNTFYI